MSAWNLGTGEQLCGLRVEMEGPGLGEGARAWGWRRVQGTFKMFGG